MFGWPCKKYYVYILYIYLSNQRHDVDVTNPFPPGGKPLLNISKHLLNVWWCDKLCTSWFTNYTNNSWGTMFSHIFLLLNCKYYHCTANYNYIFSFDDDVSHVLHILVKLHHSRMAEVYMRVTYYVVMFTMTLERKCFVDQKMPIACLFCNSHIILTFYKYIYM